MAGVMLLLGWIKAPVRADAAVWNEKFQLEFLDYAAINENSQQSSLYPTRIPSVLPALDSRQCCSNVRAEILDLTAAPRRDFAFQATVSRFSGNAFLADSVENPCLTPGSSTTLLVPDLPPLTQQGEQICREHGIAIPATLATLHPDQHALAVDIGDLECRNLGHAQAGAIGDRESCLMLQAGGRVEQSRNLLAAQHHGQVARMRQPDQLARQVRPVDRVREEEPQRRDDAVHGRRRHAGVTLLDL